MASSFQQTLRDVDVVEGWMTDAQARLLWERAQAVPVPGRIVEIGSFRGRSLIVLARGSADGIDLVAIDPHAGSDRGPQEIAADATKGAADHDVFLANLERAGVRERVTYIRKMSSEAVADVDGPIDLLYIDGAHRAGPALGDIRTWGERVTPGGTLLIHDSWSAVGVTLALLAAMVPSRAWTYRGRVGSLAEYARVPAEDGLVRNALRQLAELPWFGRNLAIKVLIVARLGRLTRLLGHRQAGWPY